MDVFRRPEGKFKKKQTPRDEALQILKPQMDNPPAPQVHTHTHTHVCKLKHYTAHTVIWTCTVLKKKIFFFFVCPAQTSCSRLTVCICNERGGTKTHQDHQDESACSPSPASASRYQQQTKSGIDCEAFDSLCVCSVFCVDCRGCWKKEKHHRGLAAE